MANEQRKHKLMETIKWYIDKDAHIEQLKSLFLEALSKFSIQERESILAETSFNTEDEFAQSMAEEHTFSDNDSMRRYIHLDSQHISGNFACLDKDFAFHLHKIQHPDTYKGHTDFTSKEEDDAFNKMKAELNSGSESEWACQARQANENWFWFAFGTFGYKYNFSEYLGNLCPEPIED